MVEDAKLRTAAGLSSMWDGDPIKRIRSLDGVTVLPGRRVAMHIMAQPDVAAIWFKDRLLATLSAVGQRAGTSERHAHLEGAFSRKRRRHQTLRRATAGYSGAA